MPSLLLLVFVLQLAIHLINTLGKETITTLVRGSSALPNFQAGVLTFCRHGFFTANFLPRPLRMPAGLSSFATRSCA